MRLVILRLCCGALVVTAALASTSVATAGADPGQGCGQLADYCPEDEVGGDPTPGGDPATPVGSGGGSGGGSGSGGGGSVCTWEQRGTGGGDVSDDVPWNDVIGTPSPDAEFYAEVCDGGYTGRVAWIAPGDPAPAAPPSPEELAAIVRVRLEGSLPAPEVATDPGPGVAAIVGFPSFVSVTNWSGVVNDGECDPTGVLCVTVTATPSMVWSPGEPDAAATSCTGPGARFDPQGEAPEVQAAAPGACAYTYGHRTGVEGRPNTWPGEVTVTWDLAWSSDGAAGGGVLEPVAKSTAVPRSVDEVQTVVESAG